MSIFWSAFLDGLSFGGNGEMPGAPTTLFADEPNAVNEPNAAMALEKAAILEKLHADEPETMVVSFEDLPEEIQLHSVEAARRVGKSKPGKVVFLVRRDNRYVLMNIEEEEQASRYVSESILHQQHNHGT